LFTLQLLFWVILKFRSTFHCLNWSNRATLKHSCASARSGCDGAPSARFGVPPPAGVLWSYADTNGPELTCLRTPMPSQVAPRLRAGQVATPHPPRRAGVHTPRAPWQCRMRGTWPFRRPRWGTQALEGATRLGLPSRIRPLGQKSCAAAPCTLQCRSRPSLPNPSSTPSPRAPSPCTRPHTSGERPREHVLPTEPSAHRHCGHSGRLPPSSPPAITRAVSD
jgi:hypothetical protein